MERHRQDDAFFNVAEGIRREVEKVRTRDLIGSQATLPESISQPVVFLMHRRDEEARDAITALLKAIGVKVITWSNILSELDLHERDVSLAVRKGFELAHAAFILCTPDEVSFLRPELWKPLDTPNIKRPRFQPMQNVLLELGYALRDWEDRTVYITIGRPIYPSIKVDRGSMTGIGQEKLGGRTIDEICSALDVKEDPFTAQLSALPLPAEER